MKIVIASDLHGSAYFTEKLIKFYKNTGAEKLLLLGDLLYHGPRNELPNEYDCKKTAELLNNISNDIIAVRGNCDSEVDQMMLDFPMLADYAFIYDGNIRFFATHGHVYNNENLPRLQRNDILLNGHFHVQEFSEKNGYFYVNSGSVAIPKGDKMIHSCIVYENCSFQFIDIENENIYDEFSI